MEAQSNPTTRLPCAHFPKCFGCSLIGRPYREQLEWKQARVRAALSGHSSLVGIDVPPVIGSPRAFGYRNQAKLVARRAGRGILLGLYRPGTHQVIDAWQCATHDSLVNDILAAVHSLCERLEVSAYDERDGSGWLRYVGVRVSTWKKQAQLVLVVRDQNWQGQKAFMREACRIRGVVSVLLNVNPTTGNTIFGRSFIPLTKESALIDRVGDFKLRSSAGAFVQANLAMARRAYQQIVDWVEPGANDSAVDLYCGIGAITLLLATRVRAIWGIEQSDVSVVDAKFNVRLNGIPNSRFLAGESGTTLNDLLDKLGTVDIVTLNPPRKGAEEAVREAIVRASPTRIGYMSCDPETLARDLEWFSHHGYVTERLQPFDFLPQTDHVEVVALLRRNHPS